MFQCSLLDAGENGELVLLRNGEIYNDTSATVNASAGTTHFVVDLISAEHNGSIWQCASMYRLSYPVFLVVESGKLMLFCHHYITHVLLGDRIIVHCVA